MCIEISALNEIRVRYSPGRNCHAAEMIGQKLPIGPKMKVFVNHPRPKVIP
jgi:hypothetical protein